ncbi:MAG: hypothetical protein KatS3mg108_2619 [Isosphaeraceae bacterium]|jgi:hypothetical protein|nr:MAG: hypothetical protein KatS3mg108_2619 [Isosphaeraceae bacterium]
MNRVVGKKTGRRIPLDPAALLGRGSEGKVFRLGESECVKVLDHAPGAGDAARLASLIALSRKLPGFTWPTEVVSDPSTGEDVGFLMPFAPGETLESLLDARATRSIPLETKVLLAFRIAGAVASAHAHRGPRLVLGDVLKSGNVVIDGENATFVDAAAVSLFGYRDAGGDVRDAVSTLTTPGYVPKEVLENPGVIPSEASDRYALAVLLFELLFGRAPHDVRPCPAAVSLEPDDAVRRGICPRFVQHPEFDPPTYDPVDPPSEVDQLFHAAFVSTLRPSAHDWCRAIEMWLEALGRKERPRRRRRTPRWLRRLDPVSVFFVLVVVLAYALKFAWEAYAAPKPPPPAPSRPVGPPLFRELFDETTSFGHAPPERRGVRVAHPGQARRRGARELRAASPRRVRRGALPRRHAAAREFVCRRLPLPGDHLRGGARSLRRPRHARPKGGGRWPR